MTTSSSPVEDVLDLIRVLVFIQILIIVVTAIEGLVIGTLIGTPTPGILTAVAAAMTASAYRALGRRSPNAGRRLIRYQRAWIAVGLVDLLLAVFLARRGLELLPVLTRFVLPWMLIRLLKRPDVIEALTASNQLPPNQEVANVAA